MKLTFLGTRGFIEASSARHRRHSALLVEQNGEGLMIDCGLDWREGLAELSPQAILITHAHADHSGALRHGAPCPVHASAETWQVLDELPVIERRTISPDEPLHLCSLEITAVAVDHSLRAPAFGYRLDNGESRIFYAPDIAALPEQQHALTGVDLYIGDGAAGTGSKLRVEQGRLCGHAPLATQLNWCRKAGVPRMIISHCGTELVLEEEKGATDFIAALAAEFGIAVKIAYDGMQIILPY